MNKILLINKKYDIEKAGGRELLTNNNKIALIKIFEKKLIIYSIESFRINRIKLAAKAFNGEIDGYNSKIEKEILKIIKENKVEKVFVDGSNYGKIAEDLKKINPKLKIVIYFHNVEARFYWGLLKSKITIKNIVLLIINFIAEYKSTKYADIIICLSKKDSEILNKIYGKKANEIIPLVVNNNDIEIKNEKKEMLGNDVKYVLFVGGDFYANKEAVFWFAKNVSPHIKYKFIVVGRGLEKYKKELEAFTNTNVIGTVENVKKYYENCVLVVAPIFDGSGMKTKVAEALKFGKTILCSKEAYIGYEQNMDELIIICDKDKDYISYINNINIENMKKNEDRIKEIYQKKYSIDAHVANLKKIL